MVRSPWEKKRGINVENFPLQFFFDRVSEIPNIRIVKTSGDQKQRVAVLYCESRIK